MLFGLTEISFASQTDPVTGNIVVTTTILNAPPSVGAAITTPVTGTHVTAAEQTIEGSCSPSRLVRLTDNNIVLGSTLCSAGGQFSLTVLLFGGENLLRANNFDAAEQGGPETDPVLVYYDIPVVPARPILPTTRPTTTSVPTSAAADVAPIIITGPTALRSFYIGDVTSWPLGIAGGRAPYAINIDWGDGQNNVYNKAEAGKFEVTHTYTKVGGFEGSYQVILTAVDANGTQTRLQLTVLIRDRVTAISTGQTREAGGLAVAWPIWGAIAIMLVTFWMGEVAMRKLMSHRGILHALSPK